MGAARAECQWKCSSGMKNPLDIREVGAAQWPGGGTDGKGEQRDPVAVRSSSDKHFMQMCSGREPGRCSRAPCWDSPLICLCLQSVGKRVHLKPCSAAEPDRSCLDSLCHNKCHFLSLGWAGSAEKEMLSYSFISFLSFPLFAVAAHGIVARAHLAACPSSGLFFRAIIVWCNYF